MVIRADPTNPRGIVWLASYPKSGNTWVRAFLYALHHAIVGDLGDEIDINKVHEFASDDSQIEPFNKYLTRPPIPLDDREVAAARPRVHTDIAMQNNGLVLMKTHNILANQFDYPLINLAASAGAIYVVRNPLDVAVSFAHFRNEPIDQIIADMARPGFGAPNSERLIGFITDTWSNHVRAWTGRSEPAVHVVRYEDLHADPLTAFAAIAEHVLITPTADQLSRAIEMASFRRLQKAEAEAGFWEKPETAGTFFRQGQAGGWREALSADQVRRTAAAHGEQMRRFGYLPDQEQD